MKSFALIFCLFYLLVQIKAQTRPRCPDACPAVYMPVCGEAMIGGNLVRCEFGNGCEMGVSACRHKISWSGTTLNKCARTSPKCSQLR